MCFADIFTVSKDLAFFFLSYRYRLKIFVDFLKE